MDPKKPADLDPKLQETYDKLMNFQVPAQTPGQPAAPADPAIAMQTPQTPPPADPMATPPAPSSPPVAPTPTQATPAAPAPTIPPSQPMHHTMPAGDVPVITHSEEVPAEKPKQEFKAKKSGISPIVWVILGIIFVIVYTLVWVKIFNIQLPFAIPYITQ
ncbi:MAG TPA: hypothetical protein VFQ63_04160 [Patescibacteria group bacterium]|nr:hypothetical protein [Patescibacteria group bacterium]